MPDVIWGAWGRFKTQTRKIVKRIRKLAVNLFSYHHPTQFSGQVSSKKY